MSRAPRANAPIVSANAAWLRRLAVALCRDPASVDDMVQETWLAALRRPPDPERPAAPWLATVLRNLVRTRARGARNEAQRYASVAAEASTSTASDPGAELARREVLRRLATLVQELDERTAKS
jgi:DNA-directed RNA polymerase specialized sigma24 family protein